MNRVISSRRTRSVAALVLTFVAANVHAQAWEILGPGPSNNGQVEGILNREVVGAVNAIATHPSNAAILYVGAVNGGIWRSANATAASPTWTRQTDALESLSIGALEFDPNDATAQTLVAGIARTSSLSSFGGANTGMLRTTNGGTNWTVVAGSAPLVGRQVIGVAARGAILLAATDNGIYRSIDTGAGFTLVSGGAGSGLPAGSISDLAADKGNTTRFYASMLGGAVANRGLYRSNDTGATWTRVSDAAIDTACSTSRRTEIAVGASGQVYLAIVGNDGRLAEVYRSADGATGWTALGVPTTAEQNGVLFGAHPGGQGGIHLSLAADPANANLVYVAGDRQPYFGEGVSGSNQFFPNSIGANDYSGRSFRGDASQPPASRWTPLTHTDTPKTAPHADSRDMAFDAAGNLLESDDGGIFKRSAPATTAGSWTSLNGDLQITEYHSLSYDTVSNRVTGGAQDNGVTQQRDLTRTFDAVSTGDGGHVAIEDRSSAVLSTRYTSFQNLSSLRRRTVNDLNVTQATTFPPRTVIGGGPALATQFYTPIATNAAVTTGDVVNSQRLLIGAANGVYESLDGASTITFLTPSPTATTEVRVNAFRGAPIVYGLPGNPAYILVGATVTPSGGSGSNELWTRTTLGGVFVSLAVMPNLVRDVAVDRDDPTRIFAVLTDSVQFSSTSGASFSNVTGNLVSGFNPGTLRTVAFVPGSGPDLLVVSADRGVFVASAPAFNAWTRLGTGLPNAPVMEMDYDLADRTLVAGLLGRGAWILRNVDNFDALFSNGFE